MRRILLFLPAFALVLLATTSYAQTRFLDEQYGVGAAQMVNYASNFSLFNPATGQPGVIDLPMQLHEPVGDDDEGLRPVVVLFHTGNFLPQYFNGGPYGNKLDSVNVEIMTRFVKRGYVGITADYRLGWQPTAANQAVRTGSLLQAVYRASQDAHSLARFLRMTVDEMDNLYRIDPERIMFFGVGSGGYLVNAHNFLDSVDQILQNEQFYDPMGNPLVNPAEISDPEGLLPATQHVVNHAGYSSDVALTVNLAGALGDTLWIDGADNEAPTVSIHSATDPFAPYYEGTVIVPTDPPMNVVDVQGSRLMVELANDLGINDILEPANALTLPAIFDPLSSTVNRITAGYETVTFQSPITTNSRAVFQLGVDNLWTVLRTQPGSTGTSGATTGVWNWFSEPLFRATIDAINTARPTANLDADVIIAGEVQTNPNYNNPAAAKANIDTIMAHVLPRAWYALELEELVSNEEILVPANIGFELSPNPAAEGFTLRTAEGFPIRQVSIYDINGRLVADKIGLNTTSTRIDRGTMPNGTYVVRIRVDEGIVASKVILR